MLSEKYQIWGLIILIILLFILGASISIIFILNQKKFHFNKRLLKVESEFQKNMLLTQIEMQEQTFQQVSREIHDHIGQRLTLARLYINSLIKNVDTYQLEAMHESSALIEEAIRDLKNLSRSLTANVIRDEGLLQALKMEIERVSKITSLQIDLYYSDNLPFLSEENELIIFRIIQEAIQNIIKHAKATDVGISLSYSDNQLILEIRDNGIGFNITAHDNTSDIKKSGLHNLKKRTHLLQGTFNINSNEGSGTSLKFLFPNHTHLTDYATN